MTPPAAFTKRASGPEGASKLATEAAGLEWLRAADGPPVPDQLRLDPGELEIAFLPPAPPTADAARGFGRALARVHALGAAHFGDLPPGARPVDGHTWIGMAPLPCGTAPSWGEFYFRYRVEPYVEWLRAASRISPQDAQVINRVGAALVAGDPAVCGQPEPPARIHGDLWSGNVVWSPGPAPTAGDRGADSDADRVRGWLIDPCAHGGHRETDLAMLALFGLPFLDETVRGYDGECPLAARWRERTPVHQLHPLLVHVLLFGEAYVDRMQAAAAAAAALTTSSA